MKVFTKRIEREAYQHKGWTAHGTLIAPMPPNWPWKKFRRGMDRIEVPDDGITFDSSDGLQYCHVGDWIVFEDYEFFAYKAKTFETIFEAESK